MNFGCFCIHMSDTKDVSMKTYQKRYELNAKPKQSTKKNRIDFCPNVKGKNVFSHKMVALEKTTPETRVFCTTRMKVIT